MGFPESTKRIRVKDPTTGLRGFTGPIHITQPTGAKHNNGVFRLINSLVQKIEELQKKTDEKQSNESMKTSPDSSQLNKTKAAKLKRIVLTRIVLHRESE